MTTLREQIKTTLQQIAQVQNGTLTEDSDKLRLAIPEGDGMEVIISFYSDADVGCETVYNAKGKRFTFDRLGVEASFYFDSVAALPQQIADQRIRVAKDQARMALSREFNLGPVKIFATEDRIQEIVNTLQSGKTWRYMPPGFGTGYYFSTSSRIRNRFDRAQASPELVKLVGKPVYVSQFDAD